MDTWTIIWLVCLGIIAFLLVIGAVRIWVRRNYGKKQQGTVLAVRVSRENETGPMVAEQIFSSLYGIFQEHSWWQRIVGMPQDRLSFEVANVGRRIHFYLWFPRKYRNLVEGQIYAQYPDVEIAEVPDYATLEALDVAGAKNNGKNIQGETHLAIADTASAEKNDDRIFKHINLADNAYGAEMMLNDPDIFPIKRWPQFEDRITRVYVDPMAGITATLAQLAHRGDQAWVQIVFSPLDDRWRIIFTRCVYIIKKGVLMNIESLQKKFARIFCTRKLWPKFVFFPFYFLLWIYGLRAATGAGVFGASEADAGSADLEEVISKSHDRESASDAALDKVVKLMFEASIRIVYLPTNRDHETAKIKVREIAGSFQQFSMPHLNTIEIRDMFQGREIVERYRRRHLHRPFIFNTEELATVYHMPNQTVSTPNIAWVESRKMEPPVDLPTLDTYEEDELTMLGRTNFRGMHHEFGIKQKDRRRHMYIIGKTGMGKSTLLENMILSDIRNGKGLAVIDPHGDLADRILDFVPSSRTNDVILFDPSDSDFPFAFNMLENVDPALNSIVASGLVGIFKKIYGESWGPRLEHILRNTIISLVGYPGTTMLGITRILQDSDYRKRVVKSIEDPIIKAFWVHEFEKLEPRQRIEAISPILNKVGQFLSSPVIRNIVGQPKSVIDLRFAMDNGKIVIVNLSKGKIGEDNSALLGAMLITKFQLEAMSRANIPEAERRDFYLYVDEFQNFATESFATILSEARKYKLNLTMANQYIAQMPEEVSDAVFGNVGTLVSFQVGFDDAEVIGGQFGEEEFEKDIVALAIGNTYTRLLVDGMPSKVFSMSTFPPPDIAAEAGRREKIIRLSRERFTKPRDVVEDKIKRWSEGPKKIEEGPSPKKLADGKKEHADGKHIKKRP